MNPARLVIPIEVGEVGHGMKVTSAPFKQHIARVSAMEASDIPFGLTDVVAQDAPKQMQWQAFLGKDRIEVLRARAVQPTDYASYR